MEPSVFQNLGKTLVIVGVMLAGIGIVFIFGGKIPFLGRLPGDITIRREGFSLYLPIATCLLLSLLLTLIVRIFFRK